MIKCFLSQIFFLKRAAVQSSGTSEIFLKLHSAVKLNPEDEAKWIFEIASPTSARRLSNEADG